MENIIVYYPYKYHKWFAYMSMIFTLFDVCIVALCIPNVWQGIILFTILVFLGLYLTKRFYDASKAAVILMEEGVCLLGNRICESMLYISYNDIKHTYRVRSSKGDYFYILSSKTYNAKDLKRLIYRVADSARLYVDGAVVIHIDKFHDTTQVEKFIEKKTTPKGTGDGLREP